MPQETAAASPYSGVRKDSAGGETKAAPKRKDSVGNYIIPQDARRESIKDSIGPLVERRRSSICMEPPPPTGRRGSVDVFEGAPMGRRASINPNAPRLDPPTIKQASSATGPVITMECKIGSDLEPVCQWYHLDERVKNDERHKQGVKKEADGWLSWLEITQVKMKDAGKYTIKVQNGAGEQFATVFSYVEKSKTDPSKERRPSIPSIHHEVKGDGKGVHIHG